MTPLEAALVVFAMEILSASISALIGYYASKAYRASSARGLHFLYLGFAILGLGIFLRAITAIYIVVVNRIIDTVPASLVGLSNLAGIIFTLTQLVAYSLFIATYAFGHPGQEEGKAGMSGVAVAAVLPVARLFYTPALEVIAIAMLGFVAYNALINWRLRRTSNAALVFFGFGLMCLSHILFLFMVLSESLLFYGQLVQLAGFLCLLFMLVRVNRANAR